MNKKYYWADSEEGPYHEACDTKEECLIEAYQSPAACFDDPEYQDGFYIIHGTQKDNPDYDSDCPCDEGNWKWLLDGKAEYVSADEAKEAAE
ncbi:MAG: hypothetical protein JKY93_12430 [Gammaproteobacteria bacterium]|nr:hypothetical protein [Gammaproteobacteria bacterium]